MTLETIRTLHDASNRLFHDLRAGAQAEDARRAGAAEYDSWTANFEYESWTSAFPQAGRR